MDLNDYIFIAKKEQIFFRCMSRFGRFNIRWSVVAIIVNADELMQNKWLAIRSYDAHLQGIM